MSEDYYMVEECNEVFKDLSLRMYKIMNGNGKCVEVGIFDLEYAKDRCFILNKARRERLAVEQIKPIIERIRESENIKQLKSNQEYNKGLELLSFSIMTNSPPKNNPFYGK